MKATIKMFVDGKKCNYGTYDFDTNEQKNRINEIAEKIKLERSVDVEVVEVKENEVQNESTL